MRIIEILIDSLIKTSIFEMAFSKADAIRKTSELQFEIAEHLIKVFMYSESEYVNHWCNELNSWLKKIQKLKLKNSNKPLPYNVLRKILWEQPVESIEEVQSHMNHIYREYKNLSISKPDARVIHSHIAIVLHDICTDISKDKFYDVRNYIKD
jgi:hypothetical protein